MNEVLKNIEERSSIRKYKEAFPTDEMLEAVIRAGLQAPTAVNRQEVHISVVKRGNPVLLELAADVAASSGRPGPYDYNAPYVFFLSADPEFRYSAIDAGIACENMVLAAQSLGLGSVILGMPWKVFESEKKDYYGEKLQFPEGYVFEIALAIGFKDIEKNPHVFDKEKNVAYIE